MKQLKELSEHQHQVKVIQWAKLMETRWPELKWLFGTLNGIKLSIGAATKAKRGGNKKGISDLIWPYNNGKYSGLMIELKIGYNKPTPEQKDFIKFTRSQGFCSEICYGSDEAIELILSYIRGEL